MGISGIEKQFYYYCSIINLLWSLKSKMSTTFRPVIYGPCSRTGVTCVASDFGRKIGNLVDGRQMILISVHDRGSLSDVYGLLHFSRNVVLIFEFKGEVKHNYNISYT